MYTIRFYDQIACIHSVSMSEVLGWCAKSVDSVADRLVFDSFDNDALSIGSIFTANNSDILFDSAVLSALISACSFIYIGRDKNGFPEMQVIDGANATGIIDSTTCLMTEGYAVLETDEHKRPLVEAYFRPYITEYYVKGRLAPEYTFTHSAPYALLVPIINRPDAKRPFGHSRISRACMSIMQSALRTMLRSEVSAEFYSFPQKYVLGLSDKLKFDSYKATISSFLSISKDKDGDKPTLGQFTQQSMTPYMDQLKTLASLFAAETSLTLDDLGFSTSNPTSFDAIKASHEGLRLLARKAQRTFGVGFLNAGYLAACVRDGFEYDRKVCADITPVWQPVFEPDASALGAIGDAVYKINQAVPGYFGAKNIQRMTGLKGDGE